MEHIDDIAIRVKQHRELEINTETTNCAVGRSMTSYNNQEKQFWLINKAAKRVEPKDFNGNVITSATYLDAKPYNGDGFPVPRDSKLGELLVGNHEGKHKYQTPNGEIEIEIFNRATYNPSLYEDEYATDILIRLTNDPKNYSFRTLAEILTLQKEIDEVKEQLETAPQEEQELLVQRIEEKERKKKAEKKKEIKRIEKMEDRAEAKRLKYIEEHEENGK